MKFEVLKKDLKTRARRGELTLAHGTVQTPVFMPVGTVGSVKGLSSQDLESLGAQIILGNTYHLNIRPSSEYIKEKFGSLHDFMRWPHPILTDSGGFQVFILGLRGEVKEGSPDLVKITEEGAEFRSHIDGSKHFFSPERVIDIQRNLGSDIMMPLDVCTEYPATHERTQQTMHQTHRWEQRGSDYWQKMKGDSEQAYFGIVQGGTYADLRAESAQFIAKLPFDGIAIGGVSVGEGKSAMKEAVDAAIPHIPETKPRYLMGVGEPQDMIRAISQGIDMFDCVLPTRLARHGVALVGDEKRGFASLNMRNAQFRDDTKVLDETCACPSCAHGYSRAYISHLIKENELLGIRLLTLHNVWHVLDLFRRIRASLDEGTFGDIFSPFTTESMLP